MPTINVTNLTGDTKAVDAENDLSLMEVLRDNGYEEEIAAMCGGSCSCATCHVLLDATHCPDGENALPKLEEDELMLLEMADNYDVQSSRLSCQIEVNDALDGLEVTLVEID